MPTEESRWASNRTIHRPLFCREVTQFRISTSDVVTTGQTILAFAAASRKPTSCPTPHQKTKMLNRTLSLVKSRTLWTENKRVHKAKVSVISKSKSRTDGYLLPMVGDVSFCVSHPSYPKQILEKTFDLMSALCVTGPAPIRVKGPPVVRIRGMCDNAERF